MALIKCPECGKDVSNTADVCIHCGFKIAETENINELAMTKQLEIDKRKESNLKTILIVIATVVILCIGGYFVWYHSTAPERARKEADRAYEEYQKSKDKVDDLKSKLEENQRKIDALKSRQ